MAALTTADVTYTLTKKTAPDVGGRIFDMTLAFGNGTKTYPSGGIPLVKASMGCPTSIQSLVIGDESHADSYVYKYDSTNNAIRIFQVPASAALSVAAPMLELTTAATPAATTLVIKVQGY